jgi:enolase-phosphatase E1
VLAPEGAAALLLDIEGTTTPVSFVYDTLFPYARRHALSFLRARWEEPGVREDLARLREERAREPAQAPAWREDPEAVAACVHWLMDRDRKSTGLKSLQGRIWEAGFRSGELRGAVYQDVPRALARWRAQGRRLAIFSSGSVLAQKLHFSHSTGGDLTVHLEAYFDTTAGPKREPGSYARIAARLALQSSAVLFLSDLAEELDAARAAGMGTALVAREGGGGAGPDRVVRSFDEVFP